MPLFFCISVAEAWFAIRAKTRPAPETKWPCMVWGAMQPTSIHEFRDIEKGHLAFRPFWRHGNSLREALKCTFGAHSAFSSRVYSEAGVVGCRTTRDIASPADPIFCIDS